MVKCQFGDEKLKCDLIHLLENIKSDGCMKIFFGDIVLSGGEDCCEEPINLKVSSSRVVQSVNAIRAVNAKAIDRGNVQNVVEFSVKKKYKSIVDAQMSMFLHSAQIQNLEDDMTIFVENVDKKYILHDAAIQSSEYEIIGNTSECFYKIIGGRFESV